MDVTFAQMISAYSEIGILALCALMFILLAVYIIKNHGEQNKRESERVDNKDNILMESYKGLVETTIQQNNEFMSSMMNQFARQITHHTISPEESAQQSDIDSKLREANTRLRKETKACRSAIVKYHNGGRGINGQPFLKMSMTHEDLIVGVTPLIGDFKEQFRNLLGYFVSNIDKDDFCFIKSRDELKDRDASMYEFMAIRNIDTLFGISIKDSAGFPIGFVCLEFPSTEINIEKIQNLIKEDIDEIRLLMNQKVS